MLRASGSALKYLHVPIHKCAKGAHKHVGVHIQMQKPLGLLSVPVNLLASKGENKTPDVSTPGTSPRELPPKFQGPTSMEQVKATHSLFLRRSL